MMKRLLSFVLLLLVVFPSCHDIPDYPNDQRGNFDALWTILDEHYCFFREKGVDWDEVYEKYSQWITKETTGAELFEICAAMLDELKDGHVSLSSVLYTSYYRKWWTDYPQNYDKRLIDQYYFNFELRSSSGFEYGTLEDIGYLRYGSFSYGIGDGNLDAALAYMSKCKALIIDVRDNRGGNLTNVEKLVSRFITKRILAGYISHKTGPGHDQFSKPEPFYYAPAEGHIIWDKPIVVLTNRSTYSAANNFVSIMKQFPNVFIMVVTTGGGSGMPFTSELPCGWSVRFSACVVLDAKGNDTENGVEPSQGCVVDMDPLAALDGHDTILDKAIELIKSL